VRQRGNPGPFSRRGATGRQLRSLAAVLARIGGGRLKGAGSALLQLQRGYGNRYVQRVVDQARAAPVSQASLLPGPAGDRYERALGADFARVRLHTDVQADQLSRALQAQAFTTGQDIFFRRGEYDAGSTRGQHALAHELTHVVQQRDRPMVVQCLRRRGAGTEG